MPRQRAQRITTLYAPRPSQVIRRPESALLAFLLGTAIGVMATLSVLEMIIVNALEHGVWQARRRGARTRARVAR